MKNDRIRIKEETLRYISESILRCGGKCLLSVRRVSKLIARRLDLSNNKLVTETVNLVLESHPLATLYGFSHRRGKPKNPVVAKIYQLQSPSVEELAAGANVGVVV